MFWCDICNTPTTRRLFFPACGHSVCHTCVGDLIWEGTDDHFICCLDPYCPVCKNASDVNVETFNGTSKTIREKKE